MSLYSVSQLKNGEIHTLIKKEISAMKQGLSQAERLLELNKTAITQMKTLVAHQVKLIR